MRTGQEYIADMLETLEMPGVVAVTIFEHLQDELGRELLPDSVRRMLSNVASQNGVAFTARTRRFSSVSAISGAFGFHCRRRPPRHRRRRPLPLPPLSFFGWLAAAGSTCG
jgi:hypothetical protein